MSEYQDAYMCRVKVFKEKQSNLFYDSSLSVQEILKQTIESKPKAILNRKIEWEIANIEEVNKTTLYFKLGRTKNTIIGLKDEISGDYQDEEFQINPNTSVLLDWKMELLLFIPDSELCSTKDFPSRLQELLNSCEYAKENGIIFEVGLIDDPISFINWIKRSYKVISFRMTFTPSNLFDAGEDFDKPLSKIADAFGASPYDNDIKMTNKKRGLNKDAIIKVVKDTAAGGADASAVAQMKKGEKANRRRLRNNRAVVRIGSINDNAGRTEALKNMKEMYEKIKN